MKYCSNCGNKLDENMVCTNCKYDFGKEGASSLKEPINGKDNNNQSNSSVNSATKKNSLAIAGFVISLVSIFCCGMLSWVGLIFSIIGLCESKKYNGDGKSFAIAGIIISAILLLLCIALYFFGIFTNVMGNLNDGNDINLPFETMIIS